MPRGPRCPGQCVSISCPEQRDEGRENDGEKTERGLLRPSTATTITTIMRIQVVRVRSWPRLFLPAPPFNPIPRFPTSLLCPLLSVFCVSPWCARFLRFHLDFFLCSFYLSSFFCFFFCSCRCLFILSSFCPFSRLVAFQSPESGRTSSR